MIIDTVWLATRLGWNTGRTRDWLVRTGAGQKRAGRFITTPGRLAAHWPEIFELFQEEFMEGLAAAQRRQRTRGRESASD